MVELVDTVAEVEQAERRHGSDHAQYRGDP